MARRWTYTNAPLMAIIKGLPAAGERWVEQGALQLVQNTTAQIIAQGAVATGRLRDSPTITERVQYRRTVALEDEDGPVEYAAAINYGHVTASGSFVAARPFWEPAILQTADEMEALAPKFFR